MEAPDVGVSHVTLQLRAVLADYLQISGAWRQLLFLGHCEITHIYWFSVATATVGLCLDCAVESWPPCFARRAGLRADFVILDQSPHQSMADGSDQHLPGLPHIMRTYVDGKCAYGCATPL